MCDNETPFSSVKTGQSQVLSLHRTALLAANAPMDAVMAVSMHGTGTPLGDPIEVGAITGALRQPDGSRTSPVALLSNKACFGHSEGAAGLAGMVISQSTNIPQAEINNGVCDAPDVRGSGQTVPG